jgi:acetyltransferase-like isoleucine patch superfamily enzyme
MGGILQVILRIATIGVFKIGIGSFIAAGATVVRNVLDGECVRGVPARSFCLRPGST